MSIQTALGVPHPSFGYSDLHTIRKTAVLDEDIGGPEIGMLKL